ncbi:hypothetical protein [Salibacterium halotolerans]|uniref:Uncharacterized protein n=1 Tax=Salibacterium halotolerans TaxID=1884432 RepID=A0A1I5MK65_9BACI|nr:hypothetical protein [Salibacterium halotolerans]SFP09982.1 hypothetical protein SAMN05518683_102265 [Salibacterium halotolerans]
MRLVNGKKQDIGNQVDAVKEAVPLQMELYVEFAKLQKAYFDELVQAGFSESQALHIVSVQGPLANGQPSQ